MKIQTKSKRFLSDIPTIETISIVLDVYDLTEIYSAPLIGYDPLNDSQSLADWASFISTVRGAITNNTSLILLYEAEGKNSNVDNKTPLSKYFYIGVRNIYGELAGKIIVKFRLSTHFPKTLSEKANAKHLAEARSNMTGLDLSKIDIVDKELVVNNKTFKDYDAAMFAVLGLLRKIVNNYSQYDE